jgi:hypothetical protein
MYSTRNKNFHLQLSARSQCPQTLFMRNTDSKSNREPLDVLKAPQSLVPLAQRQETAKVFNTTRKKRAQSPRRILPASRAAKQSAEKSLGVIVFIHKTFGKARCPPPHFSLAVRVGDEVHGGQSFYDAANQ